MAPVSTMNCCLLSSSCKKIMPPPRVFSSRRWSPDTAFTAASYSVLTAAIVLPALLLYTKSVYSAILVQSLKSLAIRWSLMWEGSRRRNKAMKYVPGLSSVGYRASICRIISEGFMSPISGNFSNSKALAQRSLVYLDTSKVFSCSQQNSRRSPRGCH